MEPATDQTISQEAPPTLQCKRSLLPIDKYTARERLTHDIVEQRGKLGIIQIRKYKGKTFVVDVPLSPYLRTTETAAAPPQSTEKSTQAQKTSPDAPETIETDKPIEPRAISQLVKRMVEMASKITDKLGKTTDDKTPSNKGPEEHIFKPVRLPPPEQLAISNKPTQPGKTGRQAPQIETPPEVIQTPELETPNSPAETNKTPQPTTVPQKDKSQILTAQTVLSRPWWAVTILSSVLLLTAIFGWLWLYMDRQIQLDRLNQANAGIQQAHSDLAQTNQRSETLQNELNNYRAELRRTQNELSNSNVEVKKVQDELARTRQALKTIQQHNSEAVKRLNEQIRRLATQLTKLTEAPQAPPGSGI